MGFRPQWSRRRRQYDDRARADHSVFPDADVGPEEGVGANPASLPDLDLRFDKRHPGLTVVMGSGAQMRSLRDCGSCAYRHAAQIVEICSVADRGIFTDRKIPGNEYPHRRMNVDMRADARAE